MNIGSRVAMIGGLICLSVAFGLTPAPEWLWRLLGYFSGMTMGIAVCLQSMWLSQRRV